jgi:ribonuclease P protein component
MHTARNHTFPRAERLKSRKQIEALFASGKTFAVFPFRVFYRWDTGASAGAPPPDPSPALLPQVGLGASKKNFKRAVDRNRIKRLLREAYRLQKQTLLEAPSASGMRIFIVYTGKVLPELPLVIEKMAVILNKLGGMTPVKDTPASDAPGPGGRRPRSSKPPAAP